MIAGSDATFEERGVGRALVQEPIEGSEQPGNWTIESGVFSENAASLALHTWDGFRRVSGGGGVRTPR